MTESDPVTAGFERALASLPSGFFKAGFLGQTWGVTIRRSDDGRRVWLYAEELGGTDILSFNLYVTSGMRSTLKPCEMSSSKVVEFVKGVRPETA